METLETSLTGTGILLNSRALGTSACLCLGRLQETLDILRHWRLVESKIRGLPEPLANSLKLSNQQCPPLAQASAEAAAARLAVWWRLMLALGAARCPLHALPCGCRCC